LVQFNTENFPTDGQVREVMTKISIHNISKKYIGCAEKEAVSDIMRQSQIPVYKLGKHNLIKYIKKREEINDQHKIIDKLDQPIKEYWPNIDKKTL